MNKYEKYLNWLLMKVVPNNRSIDDLLPFENLLVYLYNTEFASRHPMDKNRIYDGEKLRVDFYENPDIVAGMRKNHPVSVLEVLIALAERMNQVVEDTENKTPEFFWTMIDNLGLGSEYNTSFDKAYTNVRLGVLYDNAYERDGSGGALFVIHDPNHDMRDADLWYQAMWYLADDI